MTDTVQAAQKTTAILARHVGHEPAAAWVHTAAVYSNAHHLGLVDGPDRPDPRHAAEVLATSHPLLAGFADPAVNRAWTATPPADALGAVTDLWSGHNVGDPPNRPAGHPLGDLYQALSTEARKGRALVQTPKFVADLLLDLGLDPVVRQHGEAVRMIDPACGTGHILVEAAMWLYATRHLPSERSADRVARALNAVHGVDLDPYAALVARYRLLVLACRASGRRLDQVGDMPVHVAAANSLLDRAEPMLTRGRYHAAVANPPYITVKDPALNAAIRAAYPQVCHGQYSLGLPFTALMHDLVVPGGWVTQITGNSFMKREFGKKFIEDYLPRFDLRWVIDTSGAYIPGHGTPTVILVTRNRRPVGDKVHAVLGKRGEPSRPADPARGVVWTAIVDAVREVLAFDALAAGAARAVAERDGVVDLPVATGPEDPAVEPGPAGQVALFDVEGAA